MDANKETIEVRKARLADAAGLAELSGQLGYPTTAKEMSARLRAALAWRQGACFVAETKQHGVIGWTHVSVTPLLEVPRRAELNGLVVDERVCSRGAGAELLQAAEKWAKKNGCTSMSVRSNVIRERAHAFYLRTATNTTRLRKPFERHCSESCLSAALRFIGRRTIICNRQLRWPCILFPTAMQELLGGTSRRARTGRIYRITIK
jgi:GNAT superfamily N-acetyltransferase